MTNWSFASSPLLVLLGAAVWAGAAWLCWQNATRRGGKAAAFMEALRLVIMTLLVFTLFRPELVRRIERKESPQIAVLLDASGRAVDLCAPRAGMSSCALQGQGGEAWLSSEGGSRADAVVVLVDAAARADLVASEFARDATRITVIANVATAYFNLRALDQQLYVTERTVGTREKFVELTRAQFNRGVVSGLDVNRAEATLATARGFVSLMRRGSRVAWRGPSRAWPHAPRWPRACRATSAPSRCRAASWRGPS